MSGPRALETNIDINRSAQLIPFDWNLRTRVVFGNDALDQLGSLAGGLGARRVMVVSDPGIVSAGHAGRGLDSLTGAGLQTALFDGARENPTTRHVSAGVDFAREFRPDLLVGLGGGSSMDCAKGINFIYSCGGVMADYWGVDKASGAMLPMIGIPTTSGTGSELQSFALISDAETHVKMACGDRRAACAIAILDPRLTVTQPALVTALTGIDAISHALETWVTRPRNPVSLMASRQAWELLARNFRRVADDPDDLGARGAMLLGAAMAGLAIENSMLGAAHALANPLTASYGIAHGQAVAVMLPHVVRFNGQEFGGWYSDLLATMKDDGVMAGFERSADGLAEFVTAVVSAAGLPTDLRSCGVPREDVPGLAEAAARQWTARFNPREVDTRSLAVLYENAF
jgi:alcohol dehydrogenase